MLTRNYLNPREVEIEKILHRKLVYEFVVRTCLNCDFWRENKCKKYDAVPPPEVVVFACDEWEMDIPF